MQPIISREYKFMLRPRYFAGRDKSVKDFWSEVIEFAQSVDVKARGRFKVGKERWITFLDTRDFTIKSNGVLLRLRSEGDKLKATLKCRSEDRYVAAAAQVRAAGGLEDDAKFEEDIAAPFRSRYSHSNTVRVRSKSSIRTLGDAAQIFPALGQLTRDERPCSGKTRLHVVNGTHAFERVYEGGEFDFGKTKAEVALILWSSRDDGRPIVAEFSFRYADPKERYSADAAARAMKFFVQLQRLDWCDPDGMTKTEYVYRGTAQD